jgi:hypothetical protein
MNSEVNDFPSHESRESRRYVRLGREASPLLPWVGSPDPSDSYGDMNEPFDFGFASTEGGAEEDEEAHTSAMDEIDMTEVERKLDGAIAGFQAAESRKSSSVWDDRERFWNSSPLPAFEDRCTPKKDTIFESVVWATTPRSIQNTPKSLYDSDGFLRT